MEQGIIYFILSDIILWATAMIYLKRKIRIRFRLFKTMILPLFVSLFGLFVLEALSQRLPSSIPELLAVTMLGIAFCAVYLLLLYWMGGIDKRAYCPSFQSRKNVIVVVHSFEGVAIQVIDTQRRVMEI